MSSVIVTCPKCRKQQPVDAVIPPEGLRYDCASCRSPFKVKLPPAAAAPPPPPPMPDFELAGDPHGEPTRANELYDARSMRPSRHSLGLDLGSADLPGAREDIPMPGDLPAPREDIPLPDDLLAPREDVPMPGDLPAPREDIPMPGDLLAPRDSIPLPDDFLAPRESIPRPDDLLAPRDSIPLPDDFLASRDEVPRPDDLLAPRDSMPMPGDLLKPLAGLSGRANLPVSATGQNLPAAVKGPAGQANLPVSLKGANLPVSRLGQVPLATKAQRKPKAPEFDPFAGEMPLAEGSPLEDLDLAGPGGARATLTPTEGLNGAFGLELEGAAPAEEPTGSPRRPLNISVPVSPLGDVPPPPPADGLRQLTPPVRSKKQASSDELLSQPVSRKKPLLIVGGVAAAVALGGGGFLFMRARGAEPKPEVALGPIAAEIAADNYPAYQRGADQLMEVAAKHPGSIALPAAASEDLLLAFLAHGGERSKLAQAEQAIAALPASDRPNAYAARARALLALAKGKPGDVTNLLGMEASTPEGELVVGLRDLAAFKRDAAAAAFKRFVAGRPDPVLGVYLLARALEESKPADAAKNYQAVQARTPGHFGAALGLARLAEGPEAQLVALQKLLDRKGGTVPRAELAEAHVAAGRAAQALGHSSDAAASFAKAQSADPQNPTVNVALGEGYMFEGRYTEALQRFQAAGTVTQRTTAGKFGMGGALIATGKPEAGLAQVHQAAQEDPKNPRGLFYGGLAAELAKTPDLESAAQGYRAALALDKKFLPASLKLAALMQRQGKPDEALAVLKDAEAAGAPTTALQMAWGSALIQAKEPARAEEVFRKAITATPKEVPAHLGLASALEAQGKGEEARASLEKSLAEIPDAVAVREHLAALTATLGHKEDAINHYKLAIATGRSPLSTKVAMAKLQLELGMLDDAQGVLAKVVDENPSTPDALSTLGRVWEARGESVKAVQEFRRALRFDNQPDVQLSLGRVLLKLGKESEAMAAFDAAATLPDALVERGRVFYRKGDYDKSLADFTNATRMAPKDPRAWLGLGLSHDRLGEADKASEAWKTALRLAPDDAETHYRFGKFELDKGRVKSAIEHLKTAAAHLPEKADWEPELYFQMGSAEVLGGAKPAALAAFKKYLEIAPNDAPSRPEAQKQVVRLGGKI